MTETTESPDGEPKPRVYTEAEYAEQSAKLRKANDEAKGHRLDRDKHKAEADRLAGEKADADAAVTKAQARVVRAEMRAALASAGVVDTDAVAFLRLDDAKLTDDGVENAAEMIEALREAKPYLFAQQQQAAPAAKPTSTSNPAKPPAQTPPTPKPATEMSDEEWQAARAELLKRR